MNIPDVLHPLRRRSLPMLATARGRGRGESWPNERLERLLTPHEVDDLMRGHLGR